jgi:hypothetical protein
MKSWPVFPRTLDIQSPKQLGNVYLGNIKKFIIWQAEETAGEYVPGEHKKVYNLWQAEETAGECVPGEHEKDYNLWRAKETAGECVPGNIKKL